MSFIIGNTQLINLSTICQKSASIPLSNSIIQSNKQYSRINSDDFDLIFKIPRRKIQKFRIFLAKQGMSYRGHY